MTYPPSPRKVWKSERYPEVVETKRGAALVIHGTRLAKEQGYVLMFV
jgi:hypothetical protein